MKPEPLLLPQWAQSRQEARKEALQMVTRTMNQVAASVNTIVSSVASAFQHVVDCLAKAFKPVVEAVVRAFSISTKPHYRPKRRSSRRLAVQEKRKRLGLPVDGKFLGMSRKASYALALSKQKS